MSKKLKGKARAKARKMKQKQLSKFSVKNNKSQQHIETPIIQHFNSNEDMVNHILDEAKVHAQILLDTCSPSNVDISLFQKPALRTKELTRGGIKLHADIHIGGDTVKAIGNKYGKNLVSIVQIFTKAGSMLVCVTQDMIDDAGHNWNNETVIAKDDILNRTVAALRLNSGSSIIHSIATHIAYEETSPDAGDQYYEGIDSYALYRVWD